MHVYKEPRFRKPRGAVPFLPALGVSRRLSVGLVLLAVAALADAQTAPLPGSPPPPALSARSAIVIDVETGSSIYEKSADLVIPPASLTKMVAIHVAYELAARGELSLSETVDLPPEVWARNMPPGSSLMFLGPDQSPTVLDILKGLSVSSGNDAAMALAVHVAGSVPAFAEIMNRTVREMGFEQMFFVEPSGLSEQNRITAREFASFSVAHLRRFPSVIEDLYALESYSYPSEEHLPPGSPQQPITQQNRNLLLEEYAPVDGLKTGYIEESDFNIALTGESEGMRLVAVVLGVPAETTVEGTRRRADEGRALLEYGFENFTTFRFDAPNFEPIPAYRADRRTVIPIARRIPALTVSRSLLADIDGEVALVPYVVAPLESGFPLGEVILRARGEVLARVPVVSPGRLERGPWYRVALDSLRLIFRPRLEDFGAE